MKVFISIIASIAVYGCAALIFLRILSKSGIRFKNKQLTAAVSDLALREKASVGPKEVVTVFAAAFAFRIFMHLLHLMVLYWFMNFPDIAQLAEFDGFWAKFLRQLEMWDGTNYFRIADGGYGSLLIGGEPTMLVFFPLQAWVARALNIIFHNTRVSLLMTSALAYSGGCAMLYTLVAKDYGKWTAGRAAAYISLFPFSFFFGSMMAEGILFFTMTLTLYFIREHKWIAAGIAGAFAAMSRIVGILMIVPAAVEFIEHYNLFGLLKRKKFKAFMALVLKRGMWLLVMFAGIGVYLLLNYHYTGNPFKFLEYQKTIWTHESCYFGTGIANVFGGLRGSDMTRLISIVLPFAVILLGTAVLLPYGIRRNRTMYTALALVYMAVICSVTWVPSGPRYTTCAVPLFILLADFAKRHKNADTIIIATFSLLQGMYFIAYICSMQIF